MLGFVFRAPLQRCFGRLWHPMAGVSMSSTVTAVNKRSLEKGPLKANELAEAAMLDVILPRAKTLVKQLEKSCKKRSSAEGNTVDWCRSKRSGT